MTRTFFYQLVDLCHLIWFHLIKDWSKNISHLTLRNTIRGSLLRIWLRQAIRCVE